MIYENYFNEFDLKQGNNIASCRARVREMIDLFETMHEEPISHIDITTKENLALGMLVAGKINLISNVRKIFSTAVKFQKFLLENYYIDEYQLISQWNTEVRHNIDEEFEKFLDKNIVKNLHEILNYVEDGFEFEPQAITEDESFRLFVILLYCGISIEEAYNIRLSDVELRGTQDYPSRIVIKVGTREIKIDNPIVQKYIRRAIFVRGYKVFSEYKPIQNDYLINSSVRCKGNSSLQMFLSKIPVPVMVLRRLEIAGNVVAFMGRTRVGRSSLLEKQQLWEQDVFIKKFKEWNQDLAEHHHIDDRYPAQTMYVFYKVIYREYQKNREKFF